jgi:hypothetical protein
VADAAATAARPPAPSTESSISAAAPAGAAAAAAATTAIQAVVTRYASAFSDLNAAAVHVVWPSVDERALTRAFRGLQEQQIAFSNCDISAAAASATATCGGTVRYVPKIGSSYPRVERRSWQFNLRKVNDLWIIDSVASR